MEIISRKKEFLDELEFERRSHGALFSALLVTDITKLSSIMLMVSEGDFLQQIDFPIKESNVFYLKDVVSRKKQLIPMLSEQLEKIAE